jgi:DNA-binding transcriptional regulator YhcF (GntR family)
VETFIQMFLYGRDTPQQFIKNMLLMGFQEEEISEFLEECVNE